MNKKKQRLVNIINYFSYGPIGLLPTFYWGLVQLQRIKEWHVISIVALISGLLLGLLSFKIISIYTPGISEVKNGNGFKLIHYTIAIGCFISFPLFILLNQTLIAEAEIKNYKINTIGESGSGRNRSSFVEIINDNGKLEKLNFGKPFVTSLVNKDSVKFIKKTSVFGVSSYEIYR